MQSSGHTCHTGMAISSVLAIVAQWGKFSYIFVHGVVYLPLSDELLVPSKRGSVLFKDNIPTSNVLALRLDFRCEAIH